MNWIIKLFHLGVIFILHYILSPYNFNLSSLDLLSSGKKSSSSRANGNITSRESHWRSRKRINTLMYNDLWISYIRICCPKQNLWYDVLRRKLCVFLLQITFSNGSVKGISVKSIICLSVHALNWYHCDYVIWRYETHIFFARPSWQINLWDQPQLYPLRAKCFRGSINIYLHFVSNLHIDTTQVVEIRPQIRQEPTYST